MLRKGAEESQPGNLEQCRTLFRVRLRKYITWTFNSLDLALKRQKNSITWIVELRDNIFFILMWRFPPPPWNLNFAVFHNDPAALRGSLREVLDSNPLPMKCMYTACTVTSVCTVYCTVFAICMNSKFWYCAFFGSSHHLRKHWFVILFIN